MAHPSWSRPARCDHAATKSRDVERLTWVSGRRWCSHHGNQPPIESCRPGPVRGRSGRDPPVCATRRRRASRQLFPSCPASRSVSTASTTRMVACARGRVSRTARSPPTRSTTSSPAESERDVRHLAGFTGSRWTDDVAAGHAVVLEDTVAVSVGAEVEVRGLVRNETEATVGAVEVIATLRDDRGAEVAVLTGPCSRRQPSAPASRSRSGCPHPAPTVAADRIDWATAIVDAPVSVSRPRVAAVLGTARRPAGSPGEPPLHGGRIGPASRRDLRFGAQPGFDRGE